MATYVGTLRSPVWLAPKPARFGGPGVLDAIEGATTTAGGPIIDQPADTPCSKLPLRTGDLAWCQNQCLDDCGISHCRYQPAGRGKCQLAAKCNGCPEPAGTQGSEP